AVIRPKTSIAMRNVSNLFKDCTSGSAYGLACPKSKQKLLSFGLPINFVSTSRVDYCANANLTALSRRVPKAKEMWRRKGQEVEALESTAVTEERDSRFNGSRFYSDLCPFLFSTETEAGVKRRETVWQANARPDRTLLGCCMSGTFRVSNATLSERESRWHRAPHILST